MQQQGVQPQATEVTPAFTEESPFAEFEKKQAQEKLEGSNYGALNERLNNQLTELNNQFAVLQANDKFDAITTNLTKSINSIDNGIRKIQSNKAIFGSPNGQMRLRNLLAERDQVLAQANADREKLGGDAWERMDADSKLTYTKLLANQQITPQDRIGYTKNNTIIKQTAQNLLLNIPDDKKDQVDEILFGKKKIENGQVQYDADNEPLRVSKGIAFKNKFGVYEPSVDMKVFESKFNELATQFSAAKAETPEKIQEDNLKKARSFRAEYEDRLKSIEEDFIQGGGEKEDFSLKAAVSNRTISQKEADEVQRIKDESEDLRKSGGILTPEERAEIRKKELTTELNTKLINLTENPDSTELKNLYEQGAVRTFGVVDNKLVDQTPEGKTIANKDYVIISDPEIGGQLVKVGANNLTKFLEDANKYYYSGGQFTTKAPGLLGGLFGEAPEGLKKATSLGLAGEETRNKALGITVESIFNTELKKAREAKTKLLQKEEKKLKPADLKF